VILSFTFISYRIRHFLFQWKQDSEGDIAFVILNRLAFVKYKEHTIISWKGKEMTQAGKYQGSRHQ
jgi:hypothetical protein